MTCSAHLFLRCMIVLFYTKQAAKSKFDSYSFYVNYEMLLIQMTLLATSCLSIIIREYHKTTQQFNRNNDFDSNFHSKRNCVSYSTACSGLQWRGQYFVRQTRLWIEHDMPKATMRDTGPLCKCKSFEQYTVHFHARIAHSQ